MGQGGFGTVYAAHDKKWDAVVALKVLHRISPWALYRFKNEFRAILDVRHTNLVRVYELYGEEDQWFFTMEHIDGTNPLHWLAVQSIDQPTMETSEGPRLISHLDSAGNPGDPLPIGTAATNLDEVLSIFSQIAQGLCALHASNLIHRDLKPQNVMVDAQGHVTLLDFGLAELLVDQHTSMAAHGPAGTPSYMAPELWQNAPITAAADWFSFGVLLHQALHGVLPVADQPPLLPPGHHPRGPALARLCTALLHSNPADRPEGAAVLAAFATTDSAAKEHTPRRTFVGRTKQLESLHRAFAQSTSHPMVALLVGRSGIGKTALANRFIEDLRQEHGVMVLTGRCYEQMAMPLKVLDALVDALTRRLLKLPRETVLTALPRFTWELAHVFPVLRSVEAIAQRPARTLPPDPQEIRQRAFDALADLLAALAEIRALVIYIDDLQWGDADSAHALAALLTARNAPQVLLLATCRSEDMADSAFLQAWVTDLPDHAHLFTEQPQPRPTPTQWQRIDVPPLSESQSQKMASLLLKNTDIDPQQIANEAAGSPMFVEILARHAMSHDQEPIAGTLSLDQVLVSEINLLSDAARRLLEMVAVAGQPLPIPIVLAAAALHEGPGPLDELRSDRFVRTRSIQDVPSVESYHDRVRETAIAQLSLDARRSCSLRLADAMVAAELDDPGQIAQRYAAVEAHTAARLHAIQAADEAFDALAFARAATFYQMACTALPPDDPIRERLLTRQAEALVQGGRSAEAAPLFQELADSQDDPRLLQLAAEQWMVSGHHEQGVDALKRLLVLRGLRWPATGTTLGIHIFLSLVQLRLTARIPRVGQAASDDPDVLPRLKLCWASTRALLSNDHIRGLYYMLQGLLAAFHARERSWIAQFGPLFFSNMAIMGLAWGQRMFDACFALAHEGDDPYIRAYAVQQRGYISHNLGRWVQGLTDYQEGLRLWEDECTGTGWECSITRANTSDVLLWLGRIDVLTRFSEESSQRANGLGDLQGVAAAMVYQGAAALVHGHVEKVRAIMTELLAFSFSGEFHVWHCWAHIWMMRCDLYEEDPAAAHKRLQAFLGPYRKANLQHVKAIRIYVDDLRCAIAASPDSPPEQLKDAQRSCKGLARSSRQDYQALAMQHRAAMAARSGDTQTAQDELKRALAIFREYDMALHVHFCLERLARLRGDEAALNEAIEALIALGVADPQALGRVWMPGFDA